MFLWAIKMQQSGPCMTEYLIVASLKECVACGSCGNGCMDLRPFAFPHVTLACKKGGRSLNCARHNRSNNAVQTIYHQLPSSALEERSKRSASKNHLPEALPNFCKSNVLAFQFVVVPSFQLSSTLFHPKESSCSSSATAPPKEDGGLANVGPHAAETPKIFKVWKTGPLANCVYNVYKLSFRG